MFFKTGQTGLFGQTVGSRAPAPVPACSVLAGITLYHSAGPSPSCFFLLVFHMPVYVLIPVEKAASFLHMVLGSLGHPREKRAGWASPEEALLIAPLEDRASYRDVEAG